MKRFLCTLLVFSIGLVHAVITSTDANNRSACTASSEEVKISSTSSISTYCVIDLSGGANATKYPVVYLNSEPEGGFNTEEYKTSKLVLKRVEEGSFIMGEDQTDESHRVTLTKPYYMGLFEMTRKQWDLVMGSDWSGSKDTKALFPRVGLSYDDIRGNSRTEGSKWPTSNAVDADHFLGKLRARTDIDFDLPTEAQWEYACRAGTTTVYSYGDEVDEAYMWYVDNSGGDEHEVGTKKPNPWGFYDMHGNAEEWCLDWDGTLSYGTDPKGSSSGSYRVKRGGSRADYAFDCTSFYRYRHSLPPSYYYGVYGFRLACPTPATYSITYTNLKDSTHANPTIYEEGTEVVLADPDTVAGYAFAGWTPATITADMTGPQTVTANWILEKPAITPADGTVVEDSQTVSISCAAEGATIHYTKDDSTPTQDSPVYRRFRVNGKTTVKAFAIDADGLMSEVAVSHYALGRCENPVISLSDGTVFQHSNQEVSIFCGSEGMLRYTLDGSDPTEESLVYAGPFTIRESTVVKAKMFSDLYFDSEVVMANLTREWVAVEAPIITAAASFTGSKTQVSISCATPGALIRYTTNGKTPNSHATKYTGPFDVSESCSVRAYAVLDDYADSEVASFAIEKVWGIGDSVGVPDWKFSTSGDAEWVRDTTVSQDGSESMRSGAIGNGQKSVLSTTVSGRGTVSFYWKTSCELDEELHDWDHAEFAVDGVEIVRLDGVTDWQLVSQTFTTDGDHVLTWIYVKDDVEKDGEDCTWVDAVEWIPAAPLKPSVKGDEAATVTGDAESGFVVRPGAANAEVVVEIPDGVDAAKVTVEVMPDVRTVTPNGAALRVVRGEADITDYLDIPAAVGGVIVLSAATVKAEYANEPLDTAKGAVIDLSSAESPSLTTAPTRSGLVYQLKEGATLEAMESDSDGDHTIGDGASWSPNLTVKGGSSGFYIIKVEK